MHLSAPVQNWLESLPGLLGRGTDPNTNLQQHIVHPPVFTEDGHHPVVEFTTGWLLGTICHWDGREHTLFLGFGYYLLTYEVLSIVVLLDRTLMERVIDHPRYFPQNCQEG